METVSGAVEVGVVVRPDRERDPIVSPWLEVCADVWVWPVVAVVLWTRDVVTVVPTVKVDTIEGVVDGGELLPVNDAEVEPEAVPLRGAVSV